MFGWPMSALEEADVSATTRALEVESKRRRSDTFLPPTFRTAASFTSNRALPRGSSKQTREAINAMSIAIPARKAGIPPNQYIGEY